MPLGAAGTEDKQFVALTEIDIIDHVHQFPMIGWFSREQITLTSIRGHNATQ